MEKPIQEIISDLTSGIREYNRQQAQEFDHVKMATDSLINEKMLYDTAKEVKQALPDQKTPDASMMREMQNFAVKYKKKHKWANEQQVMKAVAEKFNLLILPDTK